MTNHITPEQGFQELTKMIQNCQEVTETCRKLVSLVESVGDKHEAMGFDGMAHRHMLLKGADPERYGEMLDEYTDKAKESMEALAEVMNLIIGIVQGAEETWAAKRAMEN